MKVCAACTEELPQESFSKKQWKLKQHERRCKECIAADRALQLKPPPKPAAQERQPQCSESACWICLTRDDEPDDPLRRGGCSCQGETAPGFVHLSCLSHYAEKKSRQWYDEDAEKFIEPWQYCPNCEEKFVGRLADDLVNEFLLFVEDEYAGYPIMRLNALNMKLGTFRTLGQMEEMKDIAESMVDIVGHLKVMDNDLSERDLIMAANAHNKLGQYYGMKGNKEDAKQAVKHFRRCQKISREIGHDQGASAAEANSKRVTREYFL